MGRHECDSTAGGFGSGRRAAGTSNAEALERSWFLEIAFASYLVRELEQYGFCFGKLPKLENQEDDQAYGVNSVLNGERSRDSGRGSGHR